MPCEVQEPDGNAAIDDARVRKLGHRLCRWAILPRTGEQRDAILVAAAAERFDRLMDVLTDARPGLQGRTVMPALVNAHSHLGWEKYTSWGSANFTRENLIDHLNRHAYYGVGTVISTGSDREEIALQVQLEQRLGQIGGAHFVPSPGLGTPGGGPNPNFTADKGWWGSAGGLYEVTDPEQARSVVRAEAAKGIQVLKIWVDARDRRRRWCLLPSAHPSTKTDRPI